MAAPSSDLELLSIRAGDASFVLLAVGVLSTLASSLGAGGGGNTVLEDWSDVTAGISTTAGGDLSLLLGGSTRGDIFSRLSDFPSDGLESFLGVFCFLSTCKEKTNRSISDLFKKYKFSFY